MYYLQPCPPFSINYKKGHKRRSSVIIVEPPDPPLYIHPYDMPEIGDIKVSLSSVENHGWFILNGQTIIGDIIAEASATTLFGSTTIPDYTDKYLKQSSNLQQVTGSNNVTLTKDQLPKESLQLRSLNNTALLTIAIPNPGNDTQVIRSSYSTYVQQGGYNHCNFQIKDLSVKLNEAATQSSININPVSVGVNYMVYLGTSVIVP